MRVLKILYLRGLSLSCGRTTLSSVDALAVWEFSHQTGLLFVCLCMLFFPSIHLWRISPLWRIMWMALSSLEEKKIAGTAIGVFWGPLLCNCEVRTQADPGQQELQGERLQTTGKLSSEFTRKECWITSVDAWVSDSRKNPPSGNWKE